jgi:hypothetical protein
MPLRYHLPNKTCDGVWSDTLHTFTRFHDQQALFLFNYMQRSVTLLSRVFVILIIRKAHAIQDTAKAWINKNKCIGRIPINPFRLMQHIWHSDITCRKKTCNIAWADALRIFRRLHDLQALFSFNYVQRSFNILSSVFAMQTINIWCHTKIRSSFCTVW